MEINSPGNLTNGSKRNALVLLLNCRSPVFEITKSPTSSLPDEAFEPMSWLVWPIVVTKRAFGRSSIAVQTEVPKNSSNTTNFIFSLLVSCIYFNIFATGCDFCAIADFDIPSHYILISRGEFWIPPIISARGNFLWAAA